MYNLIHLNNNRNNLVDLNLTMACLLIDLISEFPRNKFRSSKIILAQDRAVVLPVGNLTRFFLNSVFIKC